ncbi:MAG: YfiR family protein [Rickettsiaceae bacterium]|nr:YfiR family protein [Rickettsiaceae bacterium]
MRLFCIFFCILLCLTLPLNAPAKEPLRLYEQEIKSGLLYNFLKYTNWPGSDSQSNSVVCIFGNDPFGGYLDPMGGRSVNKRVIVIRKINSLPESADCHVVFVNSEEAKRWPSLLEFLQDKPVLTVSDFEGFINSGGMIEFNKKDNRIVVEMNIDAVKKVNLTVQDRLLKLVTIKHGGR